MTTDRQWRPGGPPEVTHVKRVTRITMLVALLAAALGTTACQGTSLYTGVSSNGGWNAPISSGTSAGGGITGYPF
jgi:hypothetical protein